jgi:hypothetical protein
MANDKRFKVKNGLTTDNILFLDSSGNEITTTIENDSISWEGDSGQLFSITDDLTGTIFSVNDISGIPSIEVDDDGTVRFAEFSGNVLVGTSTDDATHKLQIAGYVASQGAALTEQSSDPADPAEGVSIMWQSDGTGSGNDGDIMMKITAGGVTKTVTLVDFSAA